MPTLLATPWPSGPVVVSTPLVQRYSGCPGVLLSSWRNRLMSSSDTIGVAERLVVLADRLHAGEVQHRIEQHRSVPGREHEAVAVRPDRVFRIEAKELLPERVGDRRHRHRRAGVPGIGGLHRVHRERADRVDAELVDIAHGCSFFAK